jgi:hypothetical protein
MRLSFPRAAVAERVPEAKPKSMRLRLASDCSETEQCCSLTDPIQSEMANPPLFETNVVSNR